MIFDEPRPSSTPSDRQLIRLALIDAGVAHRDMDAATEFAQTFHGANPDKNLQAAADAGAAFVQSTCPVVWP